VRKISGLLLFLFILGGCRSAKEDARALAESAYYELKDSRFDSRILREAGLKIDKGKKANPQEPWVYIAEAEFRLETGYTIGSWFDSATYTPGTVAGVLDVALNAYELDSSNCTAEAMLARIYIIKGDNQTAFTHMRRIYDRDPDNFYPPFLMGRIYLKSAHPEQAIPHLEQAERLAQRTFQKLAAMNGLEDAYALCHRPADEERMVKELIALEPDNAYYYESYGLFLERAGRLKEAITSYRTGVNLKPYPNIVRLLNQATRKSDSLSRARI
jgi:tetratricopeptide (TPR) repeat protein